MSLDELMRRFESGDRGPDLLRQLSDLAWRQFHDPWERRPASAEPEGPLPATGLERAPGDDRQESPRPFSTGTLVRYLRGTGRPFRECGADRYVAGYDYDSASDRCCQAFLSVEGPDRDTLCARWVSDRRVPAGQLDRAYLLCNQWNAQWRWPRAYVDLPRQDARAPDPGSGILTLDYQAYLARRIHQGLFDSLLAAVEGATWSFWEMARREFNL